jgi:aminoglycoside 3-N-acetyltransferase
MSDVTSTDILTALGSLGVRPGDLLVVHSSLSSFGHVIGGADAVAGALLDAVSPGGSLFVPTYTYARVPFDPVTSPSFDGAITEAVRHMPGAIRSKHPTHAMAGVGPASAEILAGHENLTSPFGPGTPIWRLWERDALVVLLGVDHRANSMVHVAEESLDLPYLRRTRVAQVVRPGGAIEEVVLRRPGCSAGFNKLDDILRAGGKLQEAKVGDATVRVARARDVVSAAERLLRDDPAALLCDRSTCERCAEARAMLRETESPP